MGTCQAATSEAQSKSVLSLAQGPLRPGVRFFFSPLQRPRGEVRQKSVALMVHVVDLLLKLANVRPQLLVVEHEFVERPE